MTDYIERDVAIKICNMPNYNIHDILFALKTIPGKMIPAADDVEVVRCRDCKNWNEHFKQCFHETAPGMWREENFFCANGERRTDNG